MEAAPQARRTRARWGLAWTAGLVAVGLALAVAAPLWTETVALRGALEALRLEQGGASSVYVSVPRRAMVSACVGLLGALGLSVWVYLRWSRPLDALTGPESPSAMPAALRDVHAALQHAQAQERAARSEGEAKWRAGILALPELGEEAEALHPEVLHEVEAARERGLRLRRQGDADLQRVLAAHRAGRETATQLRNDLRKAERAWVELADEARRAEVGLANASPEIEARYALERDRVQSFREASRALATGLSRTAERAEDLAQQALRATDAAAREEGRRAHIARGGKAGPAPAPPLDVWASELGTTASSLRGLTHRLEPALRVEASDWTPLQREAFKALSECARTHASVLEVVEPLLRAVSGWSEAYGEDLDAAGARLLGIDTDERVGLQEALTEVEGAAEAARTRLEAAVLRAERLLHASIGGRAS